MNGWTFNQLRLDNKAVLVAGAGDLGRVIAQGMADAGALTVVADLSGPAAEAAREIIQEDGRPCYACQMDIGRLADIDHAVQFVRKKYHKIDVAVNCVGINIRKPSLRVEEPDWDRVLNINLKGAFFFAQAAARAFIRQKTKGKIIIIASLLGLVGMEERAAYSASKAGLVNLIRALAVEWAPDHIHVNAIAPTFIPTALNRHTLKGRLRKKILERTPLKRLGRPEDLVGTAILLASEASDFMTGQTIVIDGGWLSG
jgi:NAD(P)-dependent dehydrogenase (short-subunit alcohol dehydrogenase family)